MRRITHWPFVHRIKIQFEVLIHLLAVIFWITREAPRFEPVVADVVSNASIDLVMGLIWWFAGPFLDVFGIWPFGCVTVCNRCLLLDIAPAGKGLLTCASHAKIDSDNEVGLPPVAGHVSRMLQVVRCLPS
jgi:hypothetical protein